MSRLKGKLAEEAAEHFLSEAGLKIIDRNFSCRFGEIDLIGLDGDTLVFIEVRYRKNEKYLSAVETIDYHKCKRIKTSSEAYLLRHKQYQTCYCRFDVVSITGAIEQPVIKWIKSAFQA